MNTPKPYYALACHVILALAEEGFIHSGDHEKGLTELDNKASAARFREAATIAAATIEQELPVARKGLQMRGES